jgi:hypothetical protein
MDGRPLLTNNGTVAVAHRVTQSGTLLPDTLITLRRDRLENRLFPIDAFRRLGRNYRVGAGGITVYQPSHQLIVVLIVLIIK